MYYDHVLIPPVATLRKSNISLRVGFEPTREDPIGFQVQRLNHSATTAVDILSKFKESNNNL